MATNPKHEKETEQFDAEALEAEREFAEQEAEDQTEAFNSLYAEEPEEPQDEPLTALLEPIGGAAHTVTPVVQGPTDTVERTIERSGHRIRHAVAAAIISILVIFGIGLGAGMYQSHMKSERETQALIAENERRAAEAKAAQEEADAQAEAERNLEASRRPRAIKFTVSAVDYDSLATRIPLLVTGTDFEGNELNTEAFINNEGEGLALPPGEYTADFPASPILAKGGLYKMPTDPLTFRVLNNEEEIVKVAQAIVMIPMNAAELTEDAINNAYNWGIKDAQLAGVVEENAAAARKLLAEEKARKAAEELRKQRAPLAQEFAESFYTNVGFQDDEDDSKVRVLSNWNALVGQYVAKDSSAAKKLSSGNGARYSYATRISVVETDDKVVTVDVDYVAADEVVKGWTLNTYSARVTCTFDDKNKLVDFKIVETGGKKAESSSSSDAKEKASDSSRSEKSDSSSSSDAKKNEDKKSDEQQTEEEQEDEEDEIIISDTGPGGE